MLSVSTLAGVATKWLALLPLWPAELCWLSTTPHVPDEWTLRWLREQLRQAYEQRLAAPDDRVAAHLHLGLAADAAFRQRLFNGLGLLLAVEAAHASHAAWPTVAAWEASAAEAAEGLELGLFNPQRLTDPRAPLFWRRVPATPERPGWRSFGLPGAATEAVRLPETQAAIYQPLQPGAEPAAGTLAVLVQQLRLWYAPTAGSHWLAEGKVAGLPAPVATWAYNYHFEAAPAGLVARADAPATPYPAVAEPGRLTYPLLWQPSRQAVVSKPLLRQSSILLAFGRLPKAGRFNNRTAPRAWLELSLTLRPRALDLYALTTPAVTVPPSMAECFGLPPAREFSYQPTHFYQTPDPAAETRLRELLTAYYAVQELENARRAEAREKPLLPLPWNLLHWIADAATGRAVAGYIRQRYADDQVGLDGHHLARLQQLVDELTGLLATLRPAWRQLERLPAEAAYVIVPAHLAQPAYLPGFAAAHELLFSRKPAHLAHFTFLSYAQLRETAPHPARPVYLASLQGKYWWALRQHTPETPLRWLLHAGLYHDAFCQELHRQHAAEQLDLYRQLAPLTTHAPAAGAAAQELEADLLATDPALPAHYRPTRYAWPGQPVGSEPETRLGGAFGQPTGAGGAFRPFAPARPENPPVAAMEFDLEAAWEEDAADTRPEALDAPDLGAARARPERLRFELEEDATLERYGSTASAGETTEPTQPAGPAAPHAPPARRRVPHICLNGQDCGPATRLVWVQRAAATSLVLERRPLDALRGASAGFAGDYWLDERLLRRALREQARQQDTLDISDEVLCPGGIPFWKIELGRWAENNPGPIPSKRIRRLFNTLRGLGLQLETFDYFQKNYLPYWIDDNGQTQRNAPHPDHIPQTWADRGLVSAFIGEPSPDRLMLLRIRRQEDRRARLRRYQEAGLAALNWVQEQDWEEFSLAELTQRLTALPPPPLLAVPAIRELFGAEANPALAVAEFVLARLYQSLRRVETATVC